MFNAAEEGRKMAIACHQKLKELETEENESRKRKILESEPIIQRTPPNDSSAPYNTEFVTWKENVLIRQLPIIKEKVLMLVPSLKQISAESTLDEMQAYAFVV